MLLNKRRTPFGWKVNITKKLLNVGREGASYWYARILLASRIDFDRQTRCFRCMIYESGLDHERSRMGARWSYRAFHYGCHGADPGHRFSVLPHRNA